VKLNEQHVNQAELVAKLRDNIDMQKRQINELNRFIWLLISGQGGRHIFPLSTLNDFPKDWRLRIESNPEDKSITFIASTKTLDDEAKKN